MFNLLIDIGNSDIKTGISKPHNSSLNKVNKVKLLYRFSYSKNNFQKTFSDNFNSKIISEKKFTVNKIGISVLETKNRKFLEMFFSKLFEIKPEFIDRNNIESIKITYKSGLGNDRICNALAAVTEFSEKNILIIDFGTATTYTLVLNKTLTGGMISPGIRTSLNSLIEKTSLPEINLKFPSNLINDNTIDNIRAGVLYQSLYSVERTILELRKKHKNLFVIVTGGNSDFIFKKTKLINKIDKNLVLKGINIILSE